MFRALLPGAVVLGLLSPAALAQFGGLDSILNRAAKEAQRALDQPKPQPAQQPAPQQPVPPQAAPEHAASPAAQPQPVVPATTAAAAPQGAPRWELEVSYRAALPGAQPPPEIAAVFKRARAQDEWSATIRSEFSRADRQALLDEPDPRNPKRWVRAFLFREEKKAQITMSSHRELFRFEPRYALDGELGESTQRVGWHVIVGEGDRPPQRLTLGEGDFQFDRQTGNYVVRLPEICMSAPARWRLVPLPPVHKRAAKMAAASDQYLPTSTWGTTFCLMRRASDKARELRGTVAPDATEIPFETTVTARHVVDSTDWTPPAPTVEIRGVLRRLAD